MNDDEHRVALKEHLERRICEVERRFEIKFEAIEQSIEVTAKDMERRLSDLNQLRAEVTSDRGQFLQREAYSVWRDTIEGRLTRMETRSVTRGETFALVLTIAGLVIAAVVALKLVK